MMVVVVERCVGRVEFARAMWRREGRSGLLLDEDDGVERGAPKRLLGSRRTRLVVEEVVASEEEGGDDLSRSPTGRKKVRGKINVQQEVFPGGPPP